MKGLIIGKGQVGTGLYEVLNPHHETYIKDVEELDLDGVEILHICIPYSDQFVDTVNAYIERYKPRYAVNHASVPIGTTDKLKGDVCYSPVRGKHPNLAEGIRTFEKYVAGESAAVAAIVEYFKKCGIPAEGYPGRDAVHWLEYCKLMSNIRYAYEICFMQEAQRIADEFDVPIPVFEKFEASYNVGYHKTGEGRLVRPMLKPGIIGGHCLIQNVRILSGQVKSEMLDWIEFSNMKTKAQTEKKER